MVRFEIKIICCEIKKSKMIFYYSWMTVYCSWVNILNVLEWECVFGKINILTILRNRNYQNNHKQTSPKISNYLVFVRVLEESPVYSGSSWQNFRQLSLIIWHVQRFILNRYLVNEASYSYSQKHVSNSCSQITSENEPLY